MKRNLKSYKIKIVFSLLGLFSSFITFFFYYEDLVGISFPFLLFSLFCYYFGKEKNFWKIFEENILIFFFSWILPLTILINI